MDLASYKIINYVLKSLNDRLLVGDVFFVIYKKHLIVLIMTYCFQKWIGMESQVKNIN